MLRELLALIIAGIAAIALVEALYRRALRRHRNHPSNRSRRYE
jgi:uncharacterized membrane protein SpoIIM required for sporulation